MTQKAQCQARTRGGEPCRNNALPKAKYCYVKSHGGYKASFFQRFKNFFQNHWLLGVVTTVIGVLGLGFAIYPLVKKDTTPRHGNLSGKHAQKPEKYTINIGTNELQLLPSQIENGIDLAEYFGEHPRIKIGFMKLPVKIYAEGNRQLFDVAVYGEDGKMICSVVRNEWSFNPDGQYDLNHDLNSFEIVDKELVPLFQISLKEGGNIYVGGYVRTGSQYHAYTPKSTTLYITREEVQRSADRLFKYPSREYPGLLE